MGRIYVAGTCDTKREELAYVTSLIRGDGGDAVLVDLSTHKIGEDADVPGSEVASWHPEGPRAVFTGDRGRSIEAMALAFERYMSARTDVAGLLGLGGSGGTALIAPAMRALAVGIPKLLVSTVASGNVSAYVGPSDIAMMYSVTDLAGLNQISRTVLANAAHAIYGMTRTVVSSPDSRPAVGLSMFGVTTPCVNQVVERLGRGVDSLVFHATGTGGQSMEKLADSGLLAGLIDVTTTEVCDFLLGGVFPCTGDRFGAVARTRLPYVGSCGALDMVNFGARETMPVQYQGRLVYAHNPQVTLMRTTPEENSRIGHWIGERLNECDGDVRFLIPERGVSAIDAPGAAFYDPLADAALFDALEATIRPTARRLLIRLPYHINDPEFADALVAHFKDIAAGV
jgi:uncharacterized protein (UPF0261 family)